MRLPTDARRHAGPLLALAGAAALAGLAVDNARRARAVERVAPPTGAFVEVDGVRLHVHRRGHGRPLVLLHGNGVTSLDFLLSGLFERAARDFEVLAFDRPGFGYSERPADRIWTAERQAELILRALEQLGVEQPIVLGHSWGAMVALAMGLTAPERLRALVPVSGYYFPTPRPDALAFAGPAVPVVGDVMRHTISPPLLRLMWPALAARVFAPQTPPERFRAYPRELSARPSQLQAEAAESALMMLDAARLSPGYPSLRVPTTIVAGDADRIVDFRHHAARLHDAIPGSRLIRIPGIGHMAHYFAGARILRAIKEADGGTTVREPVAAGAMNPEPTFM